MGKSPSTTQPMSGANISEPSDALALLWQPFACHSTELCTVLVPAPEAVVSRTKVSRGPNWGIMPAVALVFRNVHHICECAQTALTGTLHL